jgi:hypothetical protein
MFRSMQIFRQSSTSRTPVSQGEPKGGLDRFHGHAGERSAERGCDSLARDFERYARTVAAFVRLAMIRIMLRRLIRARPSS